MKDVLRRTYTSTSNTNITEKRVYIHQGKMREDERERETKERRTSLEEGAALLSFSVKKKKKDHQPRGRVTGKTKDEDNPPTKEEEKGGLLFLTVFE